MRTPEMVRPSILAFLKSEPLFQRKFVQMSFSPRKGIRKGSLMALWKQLEYTFHLK